MDGALNGLCNDAPWMRALVSVFKKYPSVKLCVLSEASGISRWLEITRDQCLVKPTLGPMDISRLLVSANTHVYHCKSFTLSLELLRDTKVSNLLCMHSYYTQQCNFASERLLLSWGGGEGVSVIWSLLTKIQLCRDNTNR